MAVLRLLTNRRVGTKIMIAVPLMAFVGIADGLIAMDSLGAMNRQIESEYRDSQALNSAGNPRAAVNRVWLAADDYLLAADATRRTQAQSALSTAQSQVGQYSDELRRAASTPEAATS